ncbi:hypothetical protein F0U44_17720 [Nocardioides humilatus]|uniref:Matrixin family metalloprotease n=1 Tax=Nocardioides humilatus TaxID=2607660 RepID=A0A5B1LBG1_9ACTN|nr:hypothetical protein [Nocardioides humilatus]KAA1417017.1 hypothetical protein F0U44_17720 [Nocardioides humilatus]
MLLGATLVVPGTWAAPADANNWFGATGFGYMSSCGSNNRADANPHTIYFESYSYDTFYSTNYVMADVIQPTDVDPQLVTDRTSATDVIIISKHYVDYCNKDWASSGTSGGVLGLTTCNGANASGRCGQHEVRYNLNAVDDLGSRFADWLAAHENGHAIGLAHRDTELGAMTSTPSGQDDYTSHDKAHINAAAW